MASVSKTNISCGVYQLYNLSNPSHLLLKRLMSGYKGLARAQSRQRGFAQVIFSDVVTYGDRYGSAPNLRCNGERFLRYLKLNFKKLRYADLQTKNSPSTGNTIKTWIVEIPHAQFRKHKFYQQVTPVDPLRGLYY